MNKEEVKEYIESLKPGYKCRKCVWGKKIVEDKEYDIYNVMCLFPRCIKEKNKKEEK